MTGGAKAGGERPSGTLCHVCGERACAACVRELASEDQEAVMREGERRELARREARRRGRILPDWTVPDAPPDGKLIAAGPDWETYLMPDGETETVEL